MTENYYPIYIDKKIVEIVNGITYKRVKLSFFEKVKVFFGFMDEPKPIRMQPKLLCDLIPKVKFVKGGFRCRKKII